MPQVTCAPSITLKKLEPPLHPENGPKITFFSGGSALRDVCGELLSYTHNSVHLITTFDSGGSSASLRSALHMPAVGDLRARLSAMALRGDIFGVSLSHFFERRLDLLQTRAELQAEIGQLSAGTHPWLAGLGKSLADFVRASLMQVLRVLPASFDFRGACMGNLVLAGRYLANDRDLSVAVQDCAHVLGVRGRIVPVSEQNAHLAVRFDSGRVIVGQHLFTGKNLRVEDLGRQAEPEDWPIREMWFSANLDDPTPLSVPIGSDAMLALAQSHVICYSFGSFYSSLLSALLPQGTARAIRSSRALKVFIPNPGHDPESCGMTLRDQLESLVRLLRRQEPDLEVRDVLDAVLVDSAQARYPGGIPRDWFSRYCVALLDYPVFHPLDLLSGAAYPKVDDARLTELLASLAGGFDEVALG